MIKKLLLLLTISLLSYLSYSQCGCTKIVFIVDNSGSVSTTEFTDMKRSMDSISAQLLRRYPGSEITVIQYASQNATNHTYNITVPFTNNPVTARTWNRAFATGGTVNSSYFQDHLPGSLHKMRTDSIWYAGKGADLVTGGCNTRVFVFTDAGYGGAGCCSHLINNGQATLAMTNYGEYNWHKSTFQSQWTVYHVTWGTNTTAMQAGAAIASKGGSYTGTIAPNPGDPEGAGGPRKYYPFTSFNLTQPQIDTALANINAGSFSASFPNDTICLGDTAFFNSNIVFPTSLLTWNFGDGNSDTGISAPKHVYAAAGTYQVTLIAWSADSSCKDTVTKPVVIHPPLVPNFLADTVCFGTSTTFTNTTTGYIDRLLWLFGDGDSSRFQPDTSHLYTTPGVYPVTLIVNSSNICVDSITKNVVVNDLPGANFTVTNQCQFLGVSPNNTTTVITSSLTSLNWSWDFGDGSPGYYSQNPTHTYTIPGNYMIDMIAETPEGCADTVSVPIVIDPKPEASFTADTACLLHPTTFTDLSTVSSGSVVAWSWNIPGTPTTQNTTYTFPIDGTFPITLTVTTDSTCYDDTTVQVVVRPHPTADFDYSPKEIFTFDPKVCFVNNSSGATNYRWDFNFAGGTSTVPAPCTVLFPNDDERNYNVKLVAINQYGCMDSIYKEVPVLEGFILYAPSAFTPNGDGKNEVFRVYTEGIVEYELFIINRWGETVFHSTDPDETWDGKHNGQWVKTDTYVYRAIVKSKNNDTKEFHGHVNVLK